MLKKQLIPYIIHTALISFLFIIPKNTYSQLALKLGKDKSGPAPTIAYAHSDGTSFLAMGGSVAIKGTAELNFGITYPFGKNRNTDAAAVSGGASLYLLHKESLPVAISLDASFQKNESSDVLTILSSTFYLGDKQQFLFSISPLYILKDRLDKKTGLSMGLHIMGDKFIFSPFYTILPERSFNNSIGISVSYIIQKRNGGEQM